MVPGGAMIPGVAQSFLPPDPNAPADPAQLPPAAGGPRRGVSAPADDRSKLGLGLSVAGLAVLVLSSGLGSPASVPLSAAGWRLGRRSRRSEPAPGVDHANLAVVIGAIGVALGLIALTGWIVLVAVGGWDETSTPVRDDSGLTFSVARAGTGALARLAG
jgi:hypothetical protein